MWSSINLEMCQRFWVCGAALKQWLVFCESGWISDPDFLLRLLCVRKFNSVLSVRQSILFALFISYGCCVFLLWTSVYKIQPVQKKSKRWQILKIPITLINPTSQKSYLQPKIHRFMLVVIVRFIIHELNLSPAHQIDYTFIIYTMSFA